MRCGTVLSAGSSGSAYLRYLSGSASPRERLEALAVELDDDDGDVVVAAGLVRALGEHLAGVERLGRSTRSTSRISSKRTMPREAVGAEEQRVAPAELDVREVDLHGVGGAERLEDDVVVLEGLGLFFGELAGLDELVDERLVARDLHELLAAQDVAARVADLREEEVVVDERRGGDRRAHAAARAIELRLLEDAQARRLDGAHEAPREIVALERARRSSPSTMRS